MAVDFSISHERSVNFYRYLRGIMNILIVAVLILCQAFRAESSTNRACDNQEYQKAEAKLESAVKKLQSVEKPWTELQSVFKTWEPCKLKFQDEAFIEAIANLTSTRWEKIQDLNEIKLKNHTFYKYILYALGNDIVGMERWKRISTLAKDKCPAGAERICEDILKTGDIAPAN